VAEAARERLVNLIDRIGRVGRLMLGRRAERRAAGICVKCGRVPALPQRFDDIRFGTRAPEYKQNIVLRGLKHLDIRVERASGKSFATPSAEAAAD